MVLPLSPAGLAAVNREPAQPFPFIVQELSGDLRVIILKGRSLPYRPVAWGSDLRVETKYFPGNPVAQAQVLGPMWQDTEMTGKWKDAFLFNDESRVILNGFPPTAGPGRPGTRLFGGKSFQSGGAVPGAIGEARRARTVRDAFWLIQRAGQLLRVEWGSIVRYGFISSFSANHDREEDIEWTMTFKWIGDTNAIPKPRSTPKFDAPGLLAQLLSRIQDFINSINADLALLFGRIQVVTQTITRIGNLVAELINTLASIVNVLLVPVQIIGTLEQQLTLIILAVQDLIDEVRSVPAAYAALQDGGSPIQANLASAAAAAIAFNAARLGVDAADTRQQLQEFSTPEIIAVYNATTDVTLRDVSNLYYGTPDNWPLIAEFNGLQTSLAPRGTLLRIPAVDTNAGQGGFGG